MQADHAVPEGRDGSPPVGLSAPNMPYAEGGIRSMNEGMVAPERSSDWDSEEESTQQEGIDQFVDLQVNRQRMNKRWMSSLGGTSGRAVAEGNFGGVCYSWHPQPFSVEGHSRVMLP